MTAPDRPRLTWHIVIKDGSGPLASFLVQRDADQTMAIWEPPSDGREYEVINEIERARRERAWQLLAERCEQARQRRR